MHTLGRYIGAQRTLDGNLSITFEVEEEPENIEQLEKIKDKDLVLDIKKFSKKRSLNANAYFWKLCDLIAKRLGSDKDTIYLKELRDYGVFEALDVVEQAVQYIEPLYRLVEVDHYYHKQLIDAEGGFYTGNMAALKCYIGSSHYDTKQMSELIEGTVNEAHDLGIETWTQEEIDNLLSGWAPQN